MSIEREKEGMKAGKQEQKNKKIKYWSDFCSKVGAEVKAGDVWMKFGIWFKKMGGIRREFSLPVIKDNDVVAVTNQEKAEMVAKGFKVNNSKNWID